LLTARDSTQPRVHEVLQDAFAAAAAVAPVLTTAEPPAPFMAGLTVSRDSTERPTLPEGTGAAFPVFFVRQLPWRPAMILPTSVPPRYPREALDRGYQGSVLVEFIVDTTGRSDPMSIRDVLGPSASFDGPDERRVYTAFVASVTRAVREGKFLPARLGPCPVRVRVQQQFSFALNVR
jgi:hypothetical protein